MAAILQRPVAHSRPVDSDPGGDFVRGFIGENDLRSEPVDDVVDTGNPNSVVVIC